MYGSGVIVGGGNLYENGEIDVDIDALSALQKPLMIFSVSVGKIYDANGLLTAEPTPFPTLSLRHFLIVRTSTS